MKIKYAMIWLWLICKIVVFYEGGTYAKLVLMKWKLKGHGAGLNSGGDKDLFGLIDFFLWIRRVCYLIFRVDTVHWFFVFFEVKTFSVNQIFDWRIENERNCRYDILT